MKRAILLVFILLWSVSLFPQQNDEKKSIEQDIIAYFSHIDSLIFLHNGWSDSTISIDLVPQGMEVDSLFGEVEKNEILVHKNRTGLELNSQIYARLGHSTIDVDNEDYLPYVAKIQFMLNWNILQSSLNKSKTKQSLIHLRNEIDKTVYLEGLFNREIMLSKKGITTRYAALIAQCLQIRFKILDYLAKLQNQLLQENKILMEDALTVLNKLTEVYGELSNYEVSDSINSFNLNFNHDFIYFIKIDTVAFYNQIEQSNLELKKYQLNTHLLEEQIRNTQYVDNMKVSPFLRTSYYIRTIGMANSANYDVGVNLIFPLSGEAKYKKRSLAAQQNITEADYRDLVKKIRLEAENIVEQNQKINHAITMYKTIIEHYKSYLKIRREQYELPQFEYSYIQRLNEYDKFFEQVLKLYKLKYEQNLLLLSAQKMVSGNSINGFIVIDK